MSALTDRIAAEHRIVHLDSIQNVERLACEGCDWRATVLDGDKARRTHVAEVTEAAVREHIAAALDNLARARHDDLKETKRRTRAETFAGASAMAYELAARIARGVTP